MNHVPPDEGLPPDHSVSMRKLVRSKRTKAFLTEDGRWTQDIHKAVIVSRPAQLEVLRKTFISEEVEFYYSFNEEADSQWDFALGMH